MNTIWIVLPILTLLMFDLGLTLQTDDFCALLRRPRPVLVALFGQIILLPLLAFALSKVMGLHGILMLGLMLIACCPGGSSSNVFSMLAQGDVALSVSLTALSSIITLFTLPLVMHWATLLAGGDTGTAIHLPVGNLLVQNLLLVFLPIIIGLLVRKKWPDGAKRAERLLSRMAFPLLMLLAGIFFLQHYQTISAHLSRLSLSVTLLILLSAGSAALLARIFSLTQRERRTIVIEVGMQNAAQAIAIASSPFVFADGAMAIPAIIYALMMNVILLTYVGYMKSTSTP